MVSEKRAIFDAQFGSGLREEYDFNILKASFGYDLGYQNGQQLLLILEGFDEEEEEAREILSEEGIVVNQLQIRWMVPLHGEAIVELLKRSRYTIIIENNYSGQFARYLRSETSFVPDGYIRKYDGEPFMPHHLVEAVKEQLAGKTKLTVPMHEIMV